MNATTAHTQDKTKSITQDSLERVYASSDLALCAYLQTMGHELVEIRSQGRKGVFVFRHTPELNADILNWGNNQPVLIRLRNFVNGMRDLKGLVST